MKILRFNESVRDKMTGKSKEDVESMLFKLTPYGMLDKIYRNEDMGMDFEEFEEMARERIEESLAELDKIFEKHEDKDLEKLINDVAGWVKKNGGNDVNVTDYGFKPLAKQIVSYGFQDRHDAVVIYDKEVFNSFRELLKNFAICEAQSNNRDYDY
jgi:hypothetical protein